MQAESTAAVSKPLPTPSASRGVMEIDIDPERVRSRGAADEASVRCALQLLAATRDRTEVLSEIAGEGAGINRKRLGRWVKRHAGQLVDGLKIKRSNVKKIAETWEVEPVSAVSSVSSGPGVESVVKEENIVNAGGDVDEVRHGSLIQ